MVHLNIADWAILAVTAGSAVLGVFGGFSGTLGFAAGLACALAAAKVGYPLLSAHFSAIWSAALVTLLLALLCFAVARILVRKVVNGLLAQPADAIFGALVAALAGSILSLGSVYVLRTFTDVQVESALLMQIFQIPH